MAKKVRIVFLGGVGEIGKNMTAFEYGEDIIVVDVGLSFPNTETPGIDYVIPDYSYLKSNAHRVKAVFVTHGHEDHIGALPFFLKDFDVPVYGSRLALGLLTHKLHEAKIVSEKLNAITDGTVVNIGKFSVEFVRVTHSIAGSYALSITTPKGIIFHSGDFKIDHTPIDGKVTNLSRISEIGQKGVLLLMMDSTNVERSGYSMSERNVTKALDQQFSLNKDRRIIVATFASNIHRVQQILDSAKRHNRRVSFSGKSMINIVEIARGLGELKYDDDQVVGIEKVNKVPFDRICIISTGTQGEPFSALSRMSNNEFKNVTISELDTVIFSSSPIPGNEKMIYNVINRLCQKGANVVYQALAEIHVSGHACKEELKLMFALLKPAYFIPVHGEFRHLKVHRELAAEMGIKEANVFIPDLGNVIDIDRSGIKKSNNITAGSVMLDGSGAPEMSQMLLRDRKQLSVDGFVISIISVNYEDGIKTIEPIVITRGLHLGDPLSEELRELIMSELTTGDAHELETSEAKQYLRKIIAKRVFQKLRKRPMVICILLD